MSVGDKPKNKSIKFNNDGEVIQEKSEKKRKAKDLKKNENKKFNKDNEKPKHQKSKKNHDRSNDDMGKKWFEICPEWSVMKEVIDIKEAELGELRELCRKSFANDLPKFLKNNPSDAKWLGTALHTGTAKDRINAGALLISSNPLGNLSTLETLINYTRLSNKASFEAMSIITELFMDRLLPNNRKLLNLGLRGEHWKMLKKEDLSKEAKSKIYAYWHFEDVLKEHYFEFLKNIQLSIQTGQDHNKNAAIVAASKLLSYGPEKEQMILAMLINKLGDPSNKIASKSLHHLSEVAYKHPNMVGVITNETEKMLFRSNISESAQHFGLCFLAQIASQADADVCTKLVKICFALFNVLVKKGAVNSRTMQAILRCLQKAIVEAKPPPGSTEIINKEMQDTIYRLVHLADIQISVQTLSLLLQLITIKTEKTDRFYNALYRKSLDLNLVTVGNKTAAQFLHIYHRAVHIDQNIPRAHAFLKRLLQMALYMPSQMTCGCLIVIGKILKSRKELRAKLESTDDLQQDNNAIPAVMDLSKFDSDDDEKYEDVKSDDDQNNEKVEKIGNTDHNINEDDTFEIVPSSWHHVKLTNAKIEDIGMAEKKVSEICATQYDPYCRVPSFAGAELSIQTELLLLKNHYHPTVQVFAESLIDHKNIAYYGDPLRDFGLTHFLERFAFKNPKKLNEKDVDLEQSATKQIYHKKYHSYGSRGLSVQSLTKTNCTEDERFIINYLEKQREVNVIKKKQDENDDAGDVDDDEFEAYLDGLCKKSKKGIEDDEDFEMDYMKELGSELKDVQRTSKKDKKQKKSKVEEDSADEIDEDFDDDDEMDGGSDFGDSGGENEDDFGDSEDDGSISLNGSISPNDDSNNDEDNSEGGSEYEDEPKTKKSKRGVNFNKALKNTNDMNSLFAAADDFAELLEETGKVRNQGTSKAVFNSDKSSEKQLKWEEKRRSNAGRTNNFRNKKFKNRKK